jgi:hypothetical protein
VVNQQRMHEELQLLERRLTKSVDTAPTEQARTRHVAPVTRARASTGRCDALGARQP